jgi:hypothetical protein
MKQIICSLRIGLVFIALLHLGFGCLCSAVLSLVKYSLADHEVNVCPQQHQEE